MRTTSPGTPKRVAVSLLAGALAFLGIAFAAGPAGATANVDTADRAAGATRYGTGADAANTAYPDGNDNVIIASGENFPDALSASGLAGHMDAPIMLTQRDSLPEETAAGIEELGASNATIVGGTAAVSDAVRDALEDEGLVVDRVAGGDRFETAGAVADEIGDYDRAIVASGEVAADALSAGPVAADQEDGPSPILLVTANEVPNATAQALDGVTEVIIVGGTARITEETATEAEGDSADADAERVAGVDRQATAAAVAEWTSGHMGWDPAGVLLAAPRSPSDDFSPDALVGGPLGAVNDYPILIIDECGSVGDAGIAFLEDHSDTIAQIIPIGGTAVVCDEAIEEAAAAAGDVEGESNQTFTCTGGGLGLLDEDDEDASAVAYDCDTASAAQVNIELIPCANVTTDEDGVVTFLDEENDGAGNNRADGLGTGTAWIEVINGVATNSEDQSADDVQPSNGGVTFSINTDDPTAGCVIPVVYDDANNNGQLDLNADDTPSEQFGVGPSATFIPPEAEPGAIPNDEGCGVLVGAVVKDFNSLVGADIFACDGGAVNLYMWDANDIFMVDGLPASMATFESELSKGDFLEGTYADDPEAISTFDLNDNAPLPPEITATTHDGNDVTVELFVPFWLGGGQLDSAAWADDTDLIRIFRAEYDPADFDLEECDDVSQFDLEDNFDPETTDDYEMIFEGTIDEESEDGEEDDGIFEFEDTDLNAGCYIYTGTVVVDGEESEPGQGADDFEDTTVQVGTTEGTAPQIIDADLDEGLGTPAVIDGADTFSLQFNEPMNEDIEVDGVIRFTDPDGEVFEVDCADVICDLVDGDANADDDTTDTLDENSLLEVDLDGVEPVKVGGPGDEDGAAQVPAVISELSTNFDDLSGNQTDLAGSPDKTIDNELG